MSTVEQELVRAYLACEVIRLAFRPPSTKDKATWLSMYHRTVCAFWEVDCAPEAPRVTGRGIVGCIPRSPVSVCFDYAVHGDQDFTLRLLHDETPSSTGLLWTHEADPAYYAFPHDLALSQINRRPQAIAARAWTQEDVYAVVDGLLCHPRIHLHIEEPALNHSLRIGTAQGNPFLFLFHLRYQACAIDEKRKRERERLCKLFAGAIAHRSRHIPPADLFG